MTFDMEDARRKFALWIIKQVRITRMMRVDKERREQARYYNRYEFVGGPLDGKVILVGNPALSRYEGAGVYDRGKDDRFHYQQLAGSWFKK